MNADFYLTLPINSGVTEDEHNLVPLDTPTSKTASKVLFYAISALLIIGSLTLMAMSGLAGGAAFIAASSGVGLVPAVGLAFLSAGCFGLGVAAAFMGARILVNASKYIL